MTYQEQSQLNLGEAYTTFPLREGGVLAEKKRKILILSGPTGVGKTALSLKLAHLLGGEIVSADSVQVYRGMDIGTAKVSLADQKSIRHHLVDSRELNEPFNVFDFYHEAQQAFEEIFSRGHIPIVVGGTGFYIHSLIYGPPAGPASSPEVRLQLENRLEQVGALALYEELKAFDPLYAETITPFDGHKIIRGLEIIALTNQKISSFKTVATPLSGMDFRCWFLYKPKEILYPIVNERCDQMLDQGLINEVKQLGFKGFSENSSAAQAIGYRQVLSYLQSSQTPHDLAVLIEEFKKATRRYVKRQFTWFRKEPLFRWLNLHLYSNEIALETIMHDYEQTV
ncbi:MAG: tRNA (adenosine(37)-N6)-dimethylallyltransferase MiaA [Candidatus Rhabdochlamydia sp.]